MQIFTKKIKTFWKKSQCSSKKENAGMGLQFYSPSWRKPSCKTNLEIVPAALATPLLTVASVQLFREGQNRRHTKGLKWGMSMMKCSRPLFACQLLWQLQAMPDCQVWKAVQDKAILIGSKNLGPDSMTFCFWIVFLSLFCFASVDSTDRRWQKS
jgi:hypothetical protein